MTDGGQDEPTKHEERLAVIDAPAQLPECRDDVL